MSRSLWLSQVGLALLTTASVGTMAAPAQAATSGVASVSGTVAQYKAAGGKQNRVVVTRSGNTVTIDDRVTVKAGKGCKAVKGDKTKVRCRTSKAPTRVRVYTYDRNDSIVNNSGLRITADGGSGSDSLTGGALGDKLEGGSGNDRLYGLGGKDSLTGYAGNDKLYGGDSDDFLDAGPGNDVLSGQNGHDSLLGMAGNDKEYGGPGADKFWQTSDPSGADADTFSGGSGEDVVTYISRRKAVVADNDGAKGDDGSKNEHDSIGTDVENLDGGDGSDRLTGNSVRNVLTGHGGNDILVGGAGNDALLGGPGRDHLNAGAGNDALEGDPGAGTVYADVILGGSGRDLVHYSGYTGAVTVDLDGASGDDGRSGERDTVGADVEDLLGGSGNDRLTGNAAANWIYSGNGDDVVRGGAGNDELEGGDGRDQLYGDDGDDLLYGVDTSVDRLDGGANTPVGDFCQPYGGDVAVDCERDRP